MGLGAFLLVQLVLGQHSVEGEVEYDDPDGDQIDPFGDKDDIWCLCKKQNNNGIDLEPTKNCCKIKPEYTFSSFIPGCVNMKGAAGAQAYSGCCNKTYHLYTVCQRIDDMKKKKGQW
jgi:hypothetical protein